MEICYVRPTRVYGISINQHHWEMPTVYRYVNLSRVLDTNFYVKFVRELIEEKHLNFLHSFAAPGIQ